jgi:hypothetical protein
LTTWRASLGKEESWSPEEEMAHLEQNFRSEEMQLGHGLSSIFP